MLLSHDGEIVGKVDFMNEYEIKIERSDFYEINDLCEGLWKMKRSNSQAVR